MTRDEATHEAVAELWRRGRASEWLLDEGQREWVSAFRNGEGSAVWMIGRQRGKSFAALTLACEECVRTPGIIVRYAALTGKSAKAIVVPTLAQVLADCPPDVMPDIRENTGEVLFQNGSVITWAGTDNEQFDRLRGPRAHLVLLDESAFYADLERVESALLPQLTTTEGKVLYLSTPPESIAHTFTRRWRAAQAAGRARHSTIDDNPRLGPEGVARIARTEAARLGLTLEALLLSTFWRREYKAELVTEESRAALPAWTEDLHKLVVGEWERPTHWDGYQGGDSGLESDPHAWLFAWHDPATNTVTIEDEIELPSISNTIAALADSVKAKERHLYGVNAWNGLLLGSADWRREFGELPEYLQRSVSTDAPRQPYMRVGDKSAALCKEMSLQHGLSLLPTDKHDKAFHVDATNALLGQMRIRIHKRCVRLIEQLYSTVWNKSRSEWERTDKDHGDLIDCLVYICRNVRWHRDCRPKHVDAAEKYKAEVLKRVQQKSQGWSFGNRR